MHGFLDCGDELVQLIHRALGFNQDPPIGQITNIAGHFEFPGEMQRRETESHALDPAGKMDHQMMHFQTGGHDVIFSCADDRQQSGKIRRIATGSGGILHCVFIFRFQTAVRLPEPASMNDPESDGLSENDWNDGGDLAWNEFDWERYLRAQDDSLHRYLAHYEGLKGHPDRIDEAAHLMGWDGDDEEAEAAPDAAGDAEGHAACPDCNAPEPYILHKNPVFIATRAIYLSLKRGWENLAADASKVPPPLALALQTSLHQGEHHALLGVHALDLGDYALAVSLFKRALEELNRTLALVNASGDSSRPFVKWRDDALPRCFDLREIWLRVMAECREELGRRVEDVGGEDA